MGATRRRTRNGRLIGGFNRVRALWPGRAPHDVRVRLPLGVWAGLHGIFCAGCGFRPLDLGCRRAWTVIRRTRGGEVTYACVVDKGGVDRKNGLKVIHCRLPLVQLYYLGTVWNSSFFYSFFLEFLCFHSKIYMNFVLFV